jgi:ADP-ribose pyrophosphatase YjhB (NUDIX family)
VADNRPESPADFVGMRSNMVDSCYTPAMINWCYRLAYRLAYPIMCRWWRYYGRDCVVMAVWLEDRVLAVRHSYTPGLRLPGGGANRGEGSRIAASRELEEEVGLMIHPSQLRLVWATKLPRGSAKLYEVRLETIPELRIDPREIIEAMFVPVSALHESNRRVNAYLAAAINSNKPDPALAPHRGTGDLTAFDRR